MSLRHLVLLFLLFAATPPSSALAQSRHGGGMSISETFTFPKGQRRVAIPFINAGEHIVIPVSVNGAKPLEMVFDTGMPSPGVLLYQGTAADSIRLEYSPMPIRVGGAGSADAKEARLAMNVTLATGGLTVGSSIAIVMPPTPQMSLLHDGIIGATFFRNLIVTIDQDRHELVLEQPEGFVPPKGAVEVPIDAKGGHAYVNAGLVTAEGKVTPLTLVLDMGATHSVSLNRRENPAIGMPAGGFETRIGRGMGGVMTGHVARIPGIELGGVRLANVVATFPDSAFENPRGLDSKDGNLGSGILGRFNVTLDFRSQRMFLVKNARFGEPFEWDMSGVRFDVDDAGVLSATEIQPGSPAAIAGLIVGDVLLAVDGEPADARRLQRDRARFREAGRTLTLRIRRGKDEPREVKLVLRRLV